MSQFRSSPGDPSGGMLPPAASAIHLLVAAEVLRGGQWFEYLL